MKLSCEIIEDLMPLYIDNVCSQKSREAIEEHVKDCQHCRAQMDGMDLVPIPQISATQEDLTLKKSLKKIKKRWWMSILAILMIFPIVLVGVLIKNEVRGDGIAFSNLIELWNCNRFLGSLREGNGEKAASYIDFSPYYMECRKALEITPDDYMPKLTEMEINGTRWLMRETVREKYEYDGDFWTFAIESEDPDIMIPIDAFLSVVETDNIVELKGEGYRFPGGVCYLPYETNVGTYMIHEQAWELLQQEDVLLTDCVSIIPAMLYEDLIPILRERSERWHRENYERLKDIADLDQEQFCSYMQNWYGENLERFLDRGYTLEKYGYGTAYVGARGWEISYSAILRKGGEWERVRIVLSFNGNKIYTLFAMADAMEFYDYGMLTPRFQ